MKNLVMAAMMAAALGLASGGAASAQPTSQAAEAAAKEAQRKANYQKLGQFLTSNGSAVHVEFKASEKNNSNYVGVLRNGLANTDYLEIVFGVSNDNTVSVLVYPHLSGGYINLDKARDKDGMMRQLLSFNDQNFFYWGADATGDVFARYTVTLESGFPDEAMKVVLFSIAPTDGYVGTLKRFN